MSWKKHVGKKVYEMLVPKIAKNLTARRKTRDEMIDLVNKQYKNVGVRPGQSSSKIKKEAAAKGSKIHDKWDKLISKQNKNIKETKTLLKGAGATAAAGAGAAGVSLYNKKKKK